MVEPPGVKRKLAVILAALPLAGACLLPAPDPPFEARARD